MSATTGNNSPFLKSISDYMVVRHYGKRTVRSYLYWIKNFIRTMQEQLGHRDVKTTEIYTQVLNRGARGVRSPLSDLNSA